MKDTRKIGTIEDRSADPISKHCFVGGDYTRCQVVEDTESAAKPCRLLKSELWVQTLDPIRSVQEPANIYTGEVLVSVFLNKECEVKWRPSPGFVSVQVGPSVAILLTSRDSAAWLAEAAQQAQRAFAAQEVVEGW